MDVKAIAGKIDELTGHVTDTLKKAQKETNDKLETATKSISDNVDLKIKESEKNLDAGITEAKNEAQKATKAVEEMEKKAKTSGFGFGGTQVKSFGTELGEKLLAKQDSLRDFKQNKKGFGAIDMEAKAVGNMSSTASLTGSYFVQPTIVPGVNIKPYESIHLRDILPVGQTNSNVIRYVRDNGGEGGPGMVAEGGTKPQIDRDLQVYDAAVKKIATYFRVPEEMVDDIPYLTSFLSQIGIEEVMIVEDAQILYGDGTGNNLSGLMTNATAFAASTSVVQAPNQFDVLLAAKKQGRVAKANPTVALLSPVDFYDLVSKKDTTNNYLFLGGGNGIDAQSVINTRGLRIIEHTAIAAGDFLVLDPMKAAIWDRMGTTVRFYDQDQDNAIKNLITIVIEKRLALTIYRTEGLIKGNFTTAITDLTS